MPGIKRTILSTLAYFDMFNYPLTREELYLFMPVKYEAALFDEAVYYLLAHNMAYRFDKFYTLQDNITIAQRRHAGNKKAAEMMQTARRVGHILVKFPFVRGVAVSGSLSKNFADENSDIDLFIITAANRLWLARTIMHCFKKLSFLVNKQHYFCMNYYVDECQLEIGEKNIYTATEVVTLIPLQGDIAFTEFFAANAWTREFLPNHIMRVSSAKPLESHWLKNFTEALLGNKLTDSFDSALMKITSGRWAKKAQSKKRNAHGAIMAMDTAKHYAKPSAANYQPLLLAQYNARIKQLVNEGHHSIAN